MIGVILFRLRIKKNKFIVLNIEGKSWDTVEYVIEFYLIFIGVRFMGMHFINIFKKNKGNFYFLVLGIQWLFLVLLSLILIKKGGKTFIILAIGTNIFILELIITILNMSKYRKKYINIKKEYRLCRDIVRCLRLEKHDFLNRLQVISGFVQLKKYDKINPQIKKITEETTTTSQMSRIKFRPLKAIFFSALRLARKYNIYINIEVDELFFRRMAVPEKDREELSYCMKMLLFSIIAEFKNINVKNKRILIHLRSNNKGGIYLILCYNAALSNRIKDQIEKLDGHISENGNCMKVEVKKEETVFKIRFNPSTKKLSRKHYITNTTT